MASNSRGRSIGALNRLIFLAILIPLAVIAVSFFLSPNNPFNSKPVNPAPVLIGQIQRQYKMETAEVTSSTLVEGVTKSALPFSEEKYTYQVVVTMTAGIDMSNIKDSDLTVSGQTVTLRLPAPQLLRTERSGQVVSYNRELFSGLSANKNLLDQVQEEGVRRVVRTVLQQGKLMQEARTNAEDNLRDLILKMGFNNVVFIETPDPVTPQAQPSVPPR